MAYRVAIALSLTLLASYAYSDVGPSPDIANRTRGAARVVLGRVLDVQSRFETNRFGDQLIISTLLVEVSETLKGRQAAMASVVIEGGTVGDLTLRVSDLPSMKAGDRAVFFLDAGTGGVEQLHDRGRGVLKVTSDDRIEGATVSLADIRRSILAAAAEGVRR